MKILVIGLGYVGLPLACLLAQKNNFVVGVDINNQLVDSINSGRLVTLEPGLSELLKTTKRNGNFIAQINIEPANVFIICVPSPLTEENKPDLSFINSAVMSLIPFLKPKDLIIIESTIPVGTTDKIKDLILMNCPHISYNELYVAHCPERVLPGNAINEIIYNNRIIGGTCNESTKLAVELYSTFCTEEVVTTTARMTELVKLSENSFRDINIAYANELSIICDELDLNTTELIKLANMHPRVNILSPGVGVGGHCIPVDPWFIVNEAPDITPLISTARMVNRFKEDWVVEKIVDISNKNEIESIVLAGLSYKSNTDDFRESPSLRIAEKLLEKCSLNITLVDPYIDKIKSNNLNQFRLSKEINISNNILIAILLITTIVETLNGVKVLSLAKKKFANIFRIAKAGIP